MSTSRLGLAGPIKTRNIKNLFQHLTIKNLRQSLQSLPKPEILKLLMRMKKYLKMTDIKVKTLRSKVKEMRIKLNIDPDKENKTDNVSKLTNDFSCQVELETGNSKAITILDVLVNTSTQTEDHVNVQIESKKDNKTETPKEEPGWRINEEDGDKEKSIAEQVKEVAQNALQQSGMVYVESAGMYYDYKTGYYYNSELGLYYHTDTECYYYYSDEKQTFVFHSYPDRSLINEALVAHERKKAKKHKQIKKKEDDIDNLTKNLSQDKETNEDGKSKRRKLKKRKQAKEKDEKNKTEDSEMKEQDVVVIDEKSDSKEDNNEKGSKEDLEDGECSDTSSEHSEAKEEESDASTSTDSDDESISKHHPPCMRIIVRETTLPKLKVGSLFLVTKDGGSVGREGSHAVLIRDHNVSRNHLEIKYDMQTKAYYVTDLGSKNGTVLNGTRMSESQIVSKPMPVLHGSTLQLGETKLLCHVHPGADTCGHCEPGLIMETQEEKKVAYTRSCSVQKQHQLELARLKNKYAPEPLMIEEKPYNDRAQARRETVGSSHHSEKTQSNDLDTFIAPENKGFKLLQKMGWSKGEGLGKDCQGDTEPIPLVSNDGKAGLGTAGSAGPPQPPRPRVTNSLGAGALRLAARSKMLQPPAKAFQVSDDEGEDT